MDFGAIWNYVGAGQNMLCSQTDTILLCQGLPWAASIETISKHFHGHCGAHGTILWRGFWGVCKGGSRGFPGVSRGFLGKWQRKASEKVLLFTTPGSQGVGFPLQPNTPLYNIRMNLCEEMGPRRPAAAKMRLQGRLLELE